MLGAIMCSNRLLDNALEDGVIFLSTPKEGVCANTNFGFTKYYNSTNVFPVIGDIVYTDVAKTIVFVGDVVSWYIIQGYNNINGFRINALGVITHYDACL